MHPRSIFKLNPPNYDELARKYSNLRPKCYIGAGGKICVDFRDPEAVRLVSTVLLQEYFELEVTIPQGVLVPRIPQRLNYILLIEDLLNKNNLLDEDGKVLGIDIGTGTTCIYPLLGASLNRWRFVGTDISPKSIEQARANVQANSLGEIINLVLSGQKSLFMEVFNDESFADQEFTFSMCNPPFFDQEEVDEKFSNTGAKESNEFRMNLPNARRGPPKSGTTAMDNEISFKGGEFAFVQQMIEESKQFPHRTKIYTSMVGKRISLQKLKDFLGKERIRHSEYSLNQGRTARWVLAWTFFDGIDLEIHSE